MSKKRFIIKTEQELQRRVELAKCLSCVHREMFSGILGCGYILNTHEKRGCPVGRECTRFVEGEPLCSDRDVRIHIAVSRTPELIKNAERR